MEGAPPTLVSANGVSRDLDDSPGAARKGRVTRGFGEGIRDGLTESEDALDGERPTLARLECDAADLLSALELSLSREDRPLKPAVCKGGRRVWITGSGSKALSSLGVPSRLGLGGGVLYLLTWEVLLCVYTSFCGLCMELKSWEGCSGKSSKTPRRLPTSSLRCCAKPLED